MRDEHWVFLLLTAAALCIMLAVSLSFGKRGGKISLFKRVFGAILILTFSGLAGGVGVNACNAAVVSALGLPGYAALVLLKGI